MVHPQHLVVVKYHIYSPTKGFLIVKNNTSIGFEDIIKFGNKVKSFTNEEMKKSFPYWKKDTPDAEIIASEVTLKNNIDYEDL